VAKAQKCTDRKKLAFLVVWFLRLRNFVQTKCFLIVNKKMIVDTKTEYVEPVSLKLYKKLESNTSAEAIHKAHLMKVI